MLDPLLAYYCLLILGASIAGGMIPVWFRLTHRGMEFAVSFVAGVMLGVGVLHMLPHAIIDAAASARAIEAEASGTEPPGAAAIESAAAFDLGVSTISQVMMWLLAGMLVMFFIERFFCYHHHAAPSELDEPGGQRPAEASAGHDPACQHDHHDHGHHSGHVHDLSWSGAALGLAIHSVLNGVALAAAVQHGTDGSALAGFGTFLVVFLHKPFDAMTIGMLMARGGWSLGWRHTINGLFALAIPLGALVFYVGLMPAEDDPSGATQRLYVAYALAFSAGTFLCISLSDLLPELQFHQHDRVKLSLALLAGLAVAYAASRFEARGHAGHAHAPPASQSAGDGGPG